MKPITTIFLTFLLLSFISGIYFCATHEVPHMGIEGMQSETNDGCPDMLIKSGNALLLYNSKLPEQPGVNPLPFYNLDEYINYLEIQRSKGIHCPVLFLQEENNTQGESVYRIRPNIFDQQAGLPNRPVFYGSFNAVSPDVSRNAIPINGTNANSYSGFDPTGQNIGRYTTLDALHDSTFKGQNQSENPMDDNWGGIIYTKTAVDSGKYVLNEVVPPSASGPFAEKSDNIHDQKLASQASIFA